MTNAELINRLRDVPCWDIGTETEETMLEAACALEAVDVYERGWKQIRERLEQRIAELEAQMPKEGEWIEANTRPRSAQFYCSVCHRTCYDIQPTRDKAWTKRCRYHYCPNCGAKMRGEHDEQ